MREHLVRTFILTTILACAFWPVGASPQEKSQAGTVASQEAQLRTLTQRVDDLEVQLSQLTGMVIPDVETALKTVVRAKAQSDSATLMLINRINTIQNKIKILEDKAAYADSTSFEILEQLVMIENKIVTLTRSFNELYSIRTERTELEGRGISSSEFKRKYVEALSHYQNGEFQAAIDGFSALVAANSGHPLADNSQYWLGECYYSRKNYKRAILEFEKVFEFTDSDKKDDAQLKLGLCYQRIGSKDRAREEFQKLLDYYPNSEYYQKAQNYLRRL